MKKNLFLAVAFALSSTSIYAQNKEPFVIPKLQEWRGTDGYLELNSTINLVVPSAINNEELNNFVSTFANDLRVIYPKRNIKIKKGDAKAGDIVFVLQDESSKIPNEGYELAVSSQITITAKKPIGAFWATRTILQILEQDANHNKLPKGYAKDAPKYEVRGLVIDVARKFFSIDFLRNYVKLMSYYKFNDFQIHLNDNGFKQFFNDDWSKTYAAFRLENATYPGLTAKDGSYSKQEFRDLQKLGNSYGVTIVPEIDAPAHTLAITNAVPETASKKYGADHLDLSNPLSTKVVHNIFKEYLEGPNPVFVNKEVHIGTDEYSKSEAELFRKFTDTTIKFVEGFGKQVRLWGALTHAPGTTPVKSDNITMNLWYNGYADPKEMFKLGYKGISTPDGLLYIVPKAGYYYDYLNLQHLYQKWAPNVIGNQTFEEGHKNIRGGAFAVWNDHVGNGITEEDVTDRTFPAFQVLSQKMWVGKNADSLLNYKTFSEASKKLGEGPGLNLRAKISGKDALVLNYDFATGKTNDLSGNDRNVLKKENAKITKGSGLVLGNNTVVTTPLTEIGFNYTVSFDINPAANNTENAVIFSSPKATVKLKQLSTGKLGFSREGYDYNFNYVVPENTVSKITITGDNKGTALFVNGTLVERLEGNMYTYTNTKDKMAKVQTLFFPLKQIGDTKNSFKGTISKLKVFNKVLTNEEIKNL